MTKKILGPLLALVLVGSGCTRSSHSPLVVGAIYPLSGPSAPGGRDEHRGVLLAAEMANEAGGVNGQPIEVRSLDVAGSDAAAAAVEDLQKAGVQIVLGSYGSTISGPASSATAARGMLFWETGAVGMLPASAARGDLTFRVPPTGATLGRTAIDFVDHQLAPRLHRDARSLRFAVSFVDDVYGRSVAGGAIDEMKTLGLKEVGTFGYDFRTADMDSLARKIARAKPDVLFVSAYLADGIALRRALVEQRVPLLANIGTSSSYCMPAFGKALGSDAVGVFASDKPTGWSLNATGLAPAAAALLKQANEEYETAYGEYMSAAALAGFSGAWGLFTKVMPAATGATPAAVAAAARSVDLPPGSLPNGSGLRFGSPGTTTAGDNVDAASVIWQWVAPRTEAIVWPPSLATRSIRRISVDPWVSAA
jgi:branched-chain amino acid transport system substrate-binding protein